ncbi:hypothetical protein R1sor_024967 [Riccia sorocarpa]|uniref:Reverse transcriptase zinc-binding domain-containing protein n=1 Tax=Riccia sorocarpa TaxID=122646 RepID=A0ABD3GCW4_9MARC
MGVRQQLTLGAGTGALYVTITSTDHNTPKPLLRRSHLQQQNHTGLGEESSTIGACTTPVCHKHMDPPGGNQQDQTNSPQCYAAEGATTFLRLVNEGERAEKCRVVEGTCQRCGADTETVTHFLWQCREAKSTWEKLRRILERVGQRNALQSTLLWSIDAALSGFGTSQGVIHLIVAATQAIWKDRNQKYFRNRRSNTPIAVILKSAQQEADLQLNPSANDTNWSRRLEASADLRFWSVVTNRNQEQHINAEGTQTAATQGANPDRDHIQTPPPTEEATDMASPTFRQERRARRRALVTRLMDQFIADQYRSASHVD